MVESTTGTEVAGYSYDSFDARTATGNLTQRYGFTGREVDAESGLMYLRARAYDPALGQFLQRDPIGFAAGDRNLYAYVSNNPFNASDPSGLLLNTEMVNTLQGQSTVQASSVAPTFAGIAMNSARLGAILSLLRIGTVEIDDEEGWPDDEQPVPEPEPSAQSGGAGNGDEGHHCWPTSYGFDPDQELVYLANPDHQELHRRMRQYFRGILDSLMGNLDYAPGKKNSDIAKSVGLDAIERHLQDFYDENPEYGC